MIITMHACCFLCISLLSIIRIHTAYMNCSSGICEHSCITGRGCICRPGYKLLSDRSSCLGNDYTLSFICSFITGYNIYSIASPNITSVMAINSTALQACWRSPSVGHLNVSLLGYKASCIAAYGYNHSMDYNFVITTVNFTGLLPFTFYTCCIYTVSNMGNGPSACSPIVQTLESSKLSAHIYD